MKNKAFIIIAILFTSVKTFSQVYPCYYYQIDFEGTGTYENANCHWLYNDTISNPANIWQIGPPQKTVLSSAFSNPNVIITDTINTYPVNDTSSFILGHIATLGITITNQISLSGKYYVNSDTLLDKGIIEFSPDNGISWIDVDNPTGFGGSVYTYCGGDNGMRLSGNSNGWEDFAIYIWSLSPSYTIAEGDTVLWRFTFVSDGVNTSKDGLMFDSIYVIDSPPVGIEESDSDNTISVYPTPFNSFVTLNGIEKGKQIEVYNLIGEKLFSIPISDNQKEVKLDLSSLSKGMYLIKVQTENGVLCKKIVKD